MTIRRFFVMALLLTCLTIAGMPSLAQDDEPIQLQVDAGFDNFYRPGFWLPLQIQVQNDGFGFAGRLTVRPETSGRAVNSAFSTPIDLPTGSDKTVFLYIQAQESSSTLIIELIDDEGVRFAEQAVGLTPITPNDTLHMVVSNTGASSIPLNAVSQAGFTARQGRWQVDNLPSDVAPLEAIDTLFLYDVQSDQFTVDQLETIHAWVATGGHLVTIGGPSYAQTTAAFDESLLPFIASGNENIDDVSNLAAYIDRDDTLNSRTFITTGTVSEQGEVLVATDTGLPLLIRREFGLGVVDFLTVDPTLEPIRTWSNLGDFWFEMLSMIPPEPSWSRGLLDLQDAARSIAILPNVELLPPASSMIFFIVAYILLIGPVNYFVLSRMRRRAWGWVTIPLLIVTFTLLAWNVGFNLRGNEVIVSRLYVVQSFADTDIAYQDQLVGVLSPRRETYTINAPADNMLGTLPGVEDDSPFSANVTRSTAEVSQGQFFTVDNIAIDGGIFANFSLSAVTDAPDISGQASISYLTDILPEDADLTDPTPQAIRGVVRNDSEITLENVVILARNRFYRVDGDFAPNDILDFDTSDFESIQQSNSSLIPLSSPIQSTATNDISYTTGTRRSFNETLVTSRVLLNLNWSTSINVIDNDALLDFDDEEMSRRRAFLRAFMRDQYATGGIGDQVYVIGWTAEAQAEDITITDVPYQSVDTTLHIIELETEFEQAPAGEIVTLGADQFTWATTDVAVGQVFGSFNDLTIINPGWAEFQVMPLDHSILSEVDEVLIEVNRSTSLGRQIDISLWNHDTQQWDMLDNTRVEEYLVPNPAPYLGRNNSVNLRLSIDTELSSSNANARILQLRVIQRGSF